MAKLFVIIILVSICAIFTDGLKCYVCQNCPLPETNKLQQCSSTSTTTSQTTVSTDDDTSTNSPSTTTISASTADEVTGYAADATITEEPTGDPSNTEEPTSDPSNTKEPTSDPSNTEEPTSDPSNTEEPTSDSTPEYQCFKYIHMENSVTVIDRGCVETLDGVNNAPCDIHTTYGCYWCSSDQCNSAFSLEVSISLLLFAMYLSLCLTLQTV